MQSVFNLCKLLIERGRTEGLQEKLDAYLAADRLTVEEYQAVQALLPQPKPAASTTIPQQVPKRA